MSNRSKEERYREAVDRNIKSTNRKNPLPKTLKGAKTVLGIRKNDTAYDSRVQSLLG
jgi:hypothetical protein